MPGFMPGIHVLKHARQIPKTWMAGTSPAMTQNSELTKGQTALLHPQFADRLDELVGVGLRQIDIGLGDIR
jgi:hypothetical protein